MKRIIPALIALLLTASLLASCGSDDNSSSKVTSQPDSSVTDSSTPDTADSSAPDSSVPDNEEITPNAESDFKYYELSAEDNKELAGGVCISKYVGTSNNVVIPQTIGGKQVVAIDQLAFCPYTEEEIINIQGGTEGPDGDDIGLSMPLALNKLSDMEIGRYYATVNGSESIEEIYTNLDKYKQALSTISSISSIESIKMPASLEFIGYGAFALCVNLKSVEVYEKTAKPAVIECKNHIFFGCGNLESINFYVNDSRSGGTDDQLYGCINLKTAYLYPDDDGEVNMFFTLCGCRNVKEIYIADGTTYLAGNSGVGGMGGDLVSYDTEFILYEYGIEKIHLPFTLKEMKEHTFCTDTNETLDSFILGEEEPPCNGIMNENITIITPAGSYAEQFAKDNGIKYENE